MARCAVECGFEQKKGCNKNTNMLAGNAYAPFINPQQEVLHYSN